MGPERIQTAPGPGWTRRPADALCWTASLFSACVSAHPLRWSLAAGHPGAPLTSFHPDLDTTALEQGQPRPGEWANRMLLWTEMPGRLSQSRMS